MCIRDRFLAGPDLLLLDIEQLPRLTAHSTNLYQYDLLMYLLPNKHLQQKPQHQLKLQNNVDQGIKRTEHLESRKFLNLFLLNDYERQKSQESLALLLCSR